MLEPQDVATFPGVPFNLTCAAVGPPDPVEVLWWLGGAQVGEAMPSPSVLHVPGKTGSLFPPEVITHLGGGESRLMSHLHYARIDLQE